METRPVAPFQEELVQIGQGAEGKSDERCPVLDPRWELVAHPVAAQRERAHVGSECGIVLQRVETCLQLRLGVENEGVVEMYLASNAPGSAGEGAGEEGVASRLVRGRRESNEANVDKVDD